MKLKTAEEYYNYWRNPEIDINDFIGKILSDAQAEISVLKASQLQPLPEEMPKEFPVLVGGMGHAQSIWNNIRQHYGTPWWANLKEGDEISWFGRRKTFKRIRLEMSDGSGYLIEDCRPYTGPTIAEARAKLSDDEYEVLKKQWYQEMHKNDLSAELAEQAEAEAKYREGGR